ncbi:MAG: hypothetical protein AMS20_00120 [Gemmatimonas sp. SG8_28]|nr:MAG: hypothetical protein AMS20_00120 [Gemmatimonas sp. SG8_28]
MKLSLVLPLPPNMANPRTPGAWRSWNSQKQRYTEKAVNQIRAQLGGHVPSFVRAVYTAELYTAAKHDLVNRVTLLKWPEDALVAAGIVPDDREEILRLDKLPVEHPQGYVRRRKAESMGDWMKRRLQFHREHYRVILHIVGEEATPDEN